jgi:glycosyltransferase involved in cell wall biosynthesis
MPRSEESPMISVVVPSYNHRHYLEEALESVLACRLPLELVVVDDGSTDGSQALLESWAEKESRLRFYPQENAGAHAALNRGIGLSRGELLLILNSDDAYLPGRIESLADAFAGDPELALAGSWLEVIDTAGKTLGVKEGWRSLPPPWQKKDGLGRLGDPALSLLESNYLSTTSNFACRRRLAGARPFKALRYAHDWDFALELAAAGSVLLLEQPLVKYRVHPSNTIKEGAAEGRGAMNFEILWLLAAHAHRIRLARQPSFPALDLEAEIGRGLPDFGRPDLLFGLLALRGRDETPPASYLALLDPANPLRRSFAARLAEVPP